MATESNTHEEYLQTRGVLMLATSCGFVAVVSAVAHLVLLSGLFLPEIIEFLFKLLNTSGLHNVLCAEIL